MMYDIGLLNAVDEAGGGRAGPPRKPYRKLPVKEIRTIRTSD